MKITCEAVAVLVVESVPWDNNNKNNVNINFCILNKDSTLCL